MKKLCVLLVALLIAAMAAGAVAEAGMANPWVDCGADMAKAVKAAGFEFAIPALSNYTVRAIPGEMIEVRYPRNETDTIILRKSPMEPDEGDISGDETEYPRKGTADLNGVEVSVRGDGKTVYVASFVAFDGSYSIGCTAGMTAQEALQIVKEVLAANAK